MLPSLPAGAVIARQYRIVRKLGSGGFGSVYLVENALLPGQRLALKLLHANAPDPAEWRARFIREVEILSGLTHPNIVTIRHFFEHEGDLGYTMDFVDGVGLDALAARGALGLVRSVGLAIDMLEGLSIAHARTPAIVHRDMKPQNVIVQDAGTPEERARILDFGIAKVLSDSAPPLTRGFIGSLYWASPEQCLERPVDARSDLYAVGCILFQLLSGRLPFVGETANDLLAQHVNATPPSLSAAGGHWFPPGIEEVVARALSKRPEDRYPDAASMIAALRGLAGGAPVEPEARTPRPLDLAAPITPDAPTTVGASPLRRRDPRPATAPTHDAVTLVPTGNTSLAPAPGAEPSRPLPPGALVAGQYRVVRTLGRGAFGTVYLVDDESLPGRPLALKLLHEALGERKGDLYARFQREARILADLSHPGIVTMRHFFVTATSMGYTMDFAEGVTLDALCGDGAIDTARALRRVRDALEALAVAHRHDPPIIHRDLKPTNLLVVAAGTPAERTRILDFGIAKPLEDTGAGLTRGFVGSAPWASPEQCAGRPVDARSDLYSMGCVLFELLAGRTPFRSHNQVGYLASHMMAEAPRLSEVGGGRRIPGSLDDLVAKALAKDSGARFACAEEMIAAIDDALRDLSPRVEATPTSASRRGAEAEQDALSREETLRPGLDAEHGATAVVPLPTALEGARAVCLRLAPAGAVSRLFLFAGDRLAFGRNASPPAGADAYAVLRALPCRSEELDRENWQRCLRLSNHHGELALADAGLLVTDTSSRGMAVDGRRLERGKPFAAPTDRAAVSLADGALDLRCEVVRGADGRACALVVRRVGNCEGHVYVLVRRAVTLGSGPVVPLPIGGAASGSLRVDGSTGRLALTAWDGAEVAVAGGRPAPGPTGLAPGMTIAFGAVRARVEGLSLESFVTP